MSRAYRLTPLTLSILSVSIPLLLIFISIYLSPWFSFWDNALSDLGHACKSIVAPIFNFGLAVGGFLVSIASVKYMIYYSRLKSMILLFMGFMLVMIAVYDETYGKLHGAVSILFFIGLILYLILYGVKEKAIAPLIIAVLHIAIWFMHLAQNTPPGAAIPELLAVLTMIPFYMSDYMKISKRIETRHSEG